MIEELGFNAREINMFLSPQRPELALAHAASSKWVSRE
jgi:hypothetical protein